MTDTLIDRADSGEILRLDPAVWETAELPAQRTRPLTGYLRTLPPTRALRLADAHPEQAHATGEFPLIATGAELAVAGRSYPPVGPSTPMTPRPSGPANPPTPPPPPPGRTDGYRGTRRRPAPLWARRALLIGSGVLGAVALELAGLVALAVIR